LFYWGAYCEAELSDANNQILQHAEEAFLLPCRDYRISTLTGGDVHPWRKSPPLYRTCTGRNYGNTGVTDERAESEKNEGDSCGDITLLCVRM
jgi:hypothetical protein